MWVPVLIFLLVAATATIAVGSVMISENASTQIAATPEEKRVNMGMIIASSGIATFFGSCFVLVAYLLRKRDDRPLWWTLIAVFTLMAAAQITLLALTKNVEAVHIGIVVGITIPVSIVFAIIGYIAQSQHDHTVFPDSVPLEG